MDGMSPDELVSNSTIETMRAHRTIRSFTNEPVSENVMAALFEVARHAPSSNCYQQVTIIQIKDPAIRHEIYQASLQKYVDGPNAELLLFVCDVNRNTQIRESAGVDNEIMSKATIFLQSIEDAMLAAQNVVIAAESLGLGTCYLGSIGGDTRRVIKALKLPMHTFPLVGLLIGHPSQEPALKPRLPLSITTAVDTYPEFDPSSADFEEYNETMQTYYDLRTPDRPLESFTKQICKKPGNGRPEQSPLLEILHEQGLALY